MEGMYRVEKDGVGFYAPEEQVKAWSELGYAVYKMEVVPVNTAAKVVSAAAVNTVDNTASGQDLGDEASIGVTVTVGAASEHDGA